MDIEFAVFAMVPAGAAVASDKIDLRASSPCTRPRGTKRPGARGPETAFE
jgi:hypothetical protein